MSTLRIGAPLDKAIDIAPSWPRCSLTASANWSSKASPMARHAGSRSYVTGARVLLSADTAEQRTPDFHVAQQEIFGRTGGDDFPHSRRGGRTGEQHCLRLAACVWSESVNVALHVAAQIKAGVSGELHESV